MQDELDFKRLIKEGTLEVLQSKEGKGAVQEGTIAALQSEVGKDAITDIFVDTFHDVVVPVIERLHEEHEKRILVVEQKLGINN